MQINLTNKFLERVFGSPKNNLSTSEPRRRSTKQTAPGFPREHFPKTLVSPTLRRGRNATYLKVLGKNRRAPAPTCTYAFFGAHSVAVIFGINKFGIKFWGPELKN
jgi:hypothetical protein